MKTENESTDLKFKKELFDGSYNGYVATLYTSEKGEYVIILADENSCDVLPPKIFRTKQKYENYMANLKKNMPTKAPTHLEFFKFVEAFYKTFEI